MFAGTHYLKLRCWSRVQDLCGSTSRILCYEAAIPVIPNECGRDSAGESHVSFSGKMHTHKYTHTHTHTHTHTQTVSHKKWKR
jgi:hypothetical protein